MLRFPQELQLEETKEGKTRYDIERNAGIVRIWHWLRKLMLTIFDDWLT